SLFCHNLPAVMWTIRGGLSLFCDNRTNYWGCNGTTSSLSLKIGLCNDCLLSAPALVLAVAFKCAGFGCCLQTYGVIKAAHDETARHATDLHLIYIRADRGGRSPPIRGSILRPRLTPDRV